MSIRPQFFRSHVLSAVASQLKAEASPNLIEIYLDYTCPFCYKLFQKWDEGKLFDNSTMQKYNIAFQFNHVPQPWHPFGSLVHELGIAVGLYSPSYFWKYSLILFRDCKELWTAEYTNAKSTNDLYAELSKHCEKHTDLKFDFIHEKLTGSGKSEITKALKYFTRYHRQNGVHVTPAIAINGISIGSIESSTETDKVLEIVSNAIA